MPLLAFLVLSKKIDPSSANHVFRDLATAYIEILCCYEGNYGKQHKAKLTKAGMEEERVVLGDLGGGGS